MEIVEAEFDKAKGTQYYNIQGISNWDLEKLYRLLLAEEKRAMYVQGWFRGSEDLLTELRKLAMKREWKI